MQDVCVVWFKRDIRTHDHAPLQAAIETGLPVLCVCFQEPSLEDSGHYSARHWQFLHNAVQDIFPITKMRLLRMEVMDFFKALDEQYRVHSVFSHEETGVRLTFDRDLRLAEYFRIAGTLWHEYPQGGIIRGLKHRKGWRKHWYGYMSEPIPQSKIHVDHFTALPHSFERFIATPAGNTSQFQQGGQSNALAELDDFLSNRSVNYLSRISKPLESRESCSRLSPYLAWGCISLRTVYQRTRAAGGNHRQFLSRLRWREHFIQKFESDIRYETEHINPGYNLLNYEYREDWVEAWEKGETGYPLIDACMRCVVETGYLNFRMRAMVVSFLTHHLWQDWKTGAKFLGRMFLDFEPGIHYPQFQMQAGVTGLNTVRIYNPVKQAQDHDPDGRFVAQWVPEIAMLPVHLRLEPWTMTEMESIMYGVKPGIDYPIRIVDHKKKYTEASQKLHAMKNNKEVRRYGNQLLKKLTLPGRAV